MVPHLLNNIYCCIELSYKQLRILYEQMAIKPGLHVTFFVAPEWLS